MASRGVIALVVLLALGASAIADEADDLYQGQTIVTGRGEESRAAGLPACLEEVLVKVSGDPRLIGDSRVAVLAPQAPSFVREIRYRDRLEGMPTRDEQGTRDRPHDMTVRFAPAAIDATLRSLGREPWHAQRPRVVVLLAVDNGARRYVLASDGELGRDQRDSLAAAAIRLGIPMRLPSEAALIAARIDFSAVQAIDAPALDAVVRAVPGDLALVGTLTWRDEELGWVADWRLRAQGAAHRWQIRGVSFDEAFRNGMAGAAQILSGNSAP